MVNHVYSFLNKIFSGGSDHFSEILTHAVPSAVLRVLGMLMSYLFIMLITRIYGSGVMGDYSLVITVMLIAFMFAKLGMNNVMVKFVAENWPENKERIKGVYLKTVKITLVASVTVTVCFLSVSDIMADAVFSKPYLSPYFKLAASGIIPLAFMMVHINSLRGIKKTGIFTFFMFVERSLVAFSVLGIMSIFLDKPYSPLVSMLVAIYAGSMLSWILWTKMGNLKKYAADKAVKAKSLLDYSIPLLFAEAMVFAVTSIDTLVISSYKSSIDVGVYNVAFKVALLQNIVFIAVSVIAPPKFAESYAKSSNRELKEVILESNKIIFWFSIPIVILFCTFPTFFLGLFGNEFVNAKHVFFIILAGQFVNSMLGLSGSFLYTCDRQKIYQYIWLSGMTLNLFLNLVLVPRFGIVGAAYGSLLTYLLVCVAFVVVIRMSFRFWPVYIPFVNREP